jgi:hypothetical protein
MQGVAVCDVLDSAHHMKDEGGAENSRFPGRFLYSRLWSVGTNRGRISNLMSWVRSQSLSRIRLFLHSEQ